MIRKFFFVFLLVTAALSVFAQSSPSTQNNDIKVFVYGDCMELHLPDSGNYDRWNEIQQQDLVKSYHTKNDTIKRFVIRKGYERDIWICQDGVFTHLSSTDIRDFDPYRTQKYSDVEYSKCDFFIYTGIAMDYWLSHFSSSASGRFGCFFLKRLLDASVNFSYTFNSDQSFGASALSVSLMSKVYPFNKTKLYSEHHLSPYIGVEGGYYATFVQRVRTDSWNINGIIGISWQIGPGSLDFGVQSGKQEYFVASIGYSFCPAMLSQYKKPK